MDGREVNEKGYEWHIQRGGGFGIAKGGGFLISNTPRFFLGSFHFFFDYISEEGLLPTVDAKRGGRGVYVDSVTMYV